MSRSNISYPIETTYEVPAAISLKNVFAGIVLPQNPGLADNNWNNAHQDSYCSESVGLHGPITRRLKTVKQLNPHGFTSVMVCNRNNQLIGMAFQYSEGDVGGQYRLIVFDEDLEILSVTDEEGAYFVTNGVTADGVPNEGFLWAAGFAASSGAASVRWKTPYENCGLLKPGQGNIGSGTTPTLMDAEDGAKLVAITDNAYPRMHVLTVDRRTGEPVSQVPVFAPMRGCDILEASGEPFDSGPLIDVNGRYARFEITVNQDMYTYIVDNELYSRAGQLEFARQGNTVTFPCGCEGLGLLDGNPAPNPTLTIAALAFKAAVAIHEQLRT